MGEKKIIQFDSAVLQAGNVNVAEAIESENDIYFNETYVVVGDKLSGSSIHATYDLTIIGDVEAGSIEVNGELVINGNVKADKLSCRRLVCTGKVSANDILIDEDSYSKSISAGKIQSHGSLIVLDSLIADEKCEIERSLISGEGLSGSGVLSAENVVAVEYFDYDGEINSNVYEIATLFKHEKVDNDSNSSLKEKKGDIDIVENFDEILSEFFDGLVINTEDDILDVLAEVAEMQRVSFSEMYYLFSEIVRISYLEEITNLKDYLIVQYAYAMFPIKLLEYESISHVFTKLLNGLSLDDLDYSADSITEFSYSLRVMTSGCLADMDLIADKVFAFIGLKYSFVNKQFEGRKA